MKFEYPICQNVPPLCSVPNVLKDPITECMLHQCPIDYISEFMFGIIASYIVQGQTPPFGSSALFPVKIHESSSNSNREISSCPAHHFLLHSKMIIWKMISGHQLTNIIPIQNNHWKLIIHISMQLTHCGWVRHICVSKLYRHWFR